MAKNFYAEINLHIVWHTSRNHRMLLPEIESAVQMAIQDRVATITGGRFHEVGGTTDHVHLAVSVPPTILISDFVGRIKGASSHAVNREYQSRVLEWQTGYGVVSFGTRDLPWVRDYIRNKKRRHADGDVFARLERAESDDAPQGP